MAQDEEAAVEHVPLPTPRDEFLRWLEAQGIRPIAATIDHGNQGFMIALPTTGRLANVYFTTAVNAHLDGS